MIVDMIMETLFHVHTYHFPRDENILHQSALQKEISVRYKV